MSMERKRGVSLAVIFIISAVMLMLEMLFPIVLLYLPNRSATATIIAIVMLGLGFGGIIYFLIHERELADILTRGFILALPALIILGYFTTVLIARLPVSILVLSLPFALVSVYLSRAFVFISPSRVYFVNLVGSAVGAGIVFSLHPLLGEENGILLAAVLAAGAGIFVVHKEGKAKWAVIVSLVFSLFLFFYNLGTNGLDLINLIPSWTVKGNWDTVPFNFAIIAARTKGAKVLGVSKNLVSRVDAIDLPGYKVADVYYPGGIDAITDPDFRKDMQATLDAPIKLYYADRFWSRVVKPGVEFGNLPPYNILDKPRVLIIGPGGGVDIARAAFHHAASITAAEINPGIIELMRGPLYEKSGKVYDQANVVCMDGRTFVRLSKDKYDLIHLAFADLYIPLPNSDIFLENYLYTREAFHDYFQHLTDNGIIAIYKIANLTAWYKELHRIAATARAMLEAEGIRNPRSHILAAGLQDPNGKCMAYIIIKRSPFTDAEIASIKEKIKPPLQIFELPGIDAPDSLFKDILQAPNLKQYLDSLPYDISPTTDDRPFFYLFDRVRIFHWLYFGIFMLVIGAVIIIPLLVIMIRQRLFKQGRFMIAALYFSVIAVGYMFLQTTMLQKFNLFLGSPILSLTIVITAFLIFGGLGSELSRRIPARTHFIFILLVAGLTIIYALFLDKILIPASMPTTFARGMVTLGLLAPLCIAIGFPFPQALERIKHGLAEKHAALFFAINGAASSFAVALFTLIVPSVGLFDCTIAAGALYVVATVIFFAL